MAKYDLKTILNIEEEIAMPNGRVFKIRDLTIKERAQVENILKDVEKETVAALRPLSFFEKLFGLKKKNIFNGQKDAMDFKFIKTVLDFCNPNQPFTIADFESMSIKQTVELISIIVKNAFFLDLPEMAKRAVEREAQKQ
jgi:hypothetical protein